MKYLHCTPGLVAVFATLMVGLPRAFAEERPSDSVITTWVQAALRDDPRVESTEIKVSTTKGIVTLTGSTSNLASKNYANKEAKKIKGVLGVVDEINVKPDFRYDWDIAQDIRHRLVNSAFVHSHFLHVNVHDGQATLSGTVDSGAQKNWAEVLTSEVRGVRGVDNDLIVRYESARPDKEIADDVVATIARDVYLTGLSITATVHDGVVTLQGSVGNWLQKDRAADQAWYVDGVRQVKNNLNVDWWKERGVRNDAPHPSDQALKESVRDELYQDLRVEPYDVQAEASLGHVTLRGSVPTFSQRGIAEQDARDVVGVSGVTNLLIVSPYPRSDDKIKEEIVSSIDSDALLVFQNITVTVDHGVVTLTGKVDSDYERWHAKDLASRVKGVTDVINDLLITEPLKLTDESIRQQIEDHLRRDDQTRWIVDQIHVAVDSGKVTLTGAVNFWSERSEADQIACLTDGVTSVDNELQVLIK